MLQVRCSLVRKTDGVASVLMQAGRRELSLKDQALITSEYSTFVQLSIFFGAVGNDRRNEVK